MPTYTEHPICRSSPHDKPANHRSLPGADIRPRRLGNPTPANPRSLRKHRPRHRSPDPNPHPAGNGIWRHSNAPNATPMTYRRKTCENCGVKLSATESYWCDPCRTDIQSYFTAADKAYKSWSKIMLALIDFGLTPNQAATTLKVVRDSFIDPKPKSTIVYTSHTNTTYSHANRHHETNEFLKPK